MVGVPSLTKCDSGPTLRIDWPICIRCSVAINQGPEDKGNQQGGDGRVDRPEGDVTENVQHRVICMQRI